MNKHKAYHPNGLQRQALSCLCILGAVAAAVAAEPTEPISGTYEVTVSNGVTETWSNPVAGTGLIVKKGAGTLVFAGANATFSGGISVNEGAIKATATGAFGTGPITNNFWSSQILFAADKGVFPNDIYQAVAHGGNYSDVTSAIIYFTDTRLTGDIVAAPNANLDLRNYRMNNGSGPTNPKGPWVEYWGRIVKSATDQTLFASAYGTNDFHGAMTCASSKTRLIGELNSANAWSAAGIYRFWSPQNAIGRIRMYSQIVECLADNVISNTAIYWDYATGDWNTLYNRQCSSFYLNGFSQRIQSLESDCAHCGSPGNGASFFSSAPATLTILGHAMGSTWAKEIREATTVARIQDAITLVIDTQEFPNYVQTFTNRHHATTGDLIVSNGTLRIVGDTMFANVPRLVVATNGVFRNESAATGALTGLRRIEIDGKFIVGEGCSSGLPLGSATLVLGADAEMTLGQNEELSFASLIVNGETKPVGTYTSAEIPQLKNGSILVMGDVSESTWTGEGGADTAIRTLANWSTETVDLASGGLSATFATGGSVASVSDTVRFRALALDAAEGEIGFSFVKAADAANMLLYGTTMTLADDGGLYSFGVPLTLQGAQTLNMTVPKGDTLRFEEGLHAETGAVTITGDGTVELFGDSVIAGTLKRANGPSRLYVTGTLGTPGHVDQGAAKDNPTKVIELGSLSGSESTLQGLIVSNAVIEKPIKHHATLSASVLHALPGTTNVFKGNIYQAEGNYSGFSLGEKAQITMEGGYYAVVASFRPTGRGHLIIRGAPFVSTGSLGFNPHLGIHVTIENTGNKVNFFSTGNSDANYGTIEFGASDVFVAHESSKGEWPILLAGMWWPANNRGFEPYTYWSGTGLKSFFEFNGTTQHVAAVAGSTFSTLHGGEGSLLVLTGTQGVDNTWENGRTDLKAKNNVFATPVDGALSLRLEGAGTFTVTNNLSGTSGSLQIASGTVHFTGNSAWTNVSEVAVTGTGALTVDACTRKGVRQTFAKTAVWRLADTARVSLADGVTMKMRELWVDGTRLCDGLYTYETAPAALKTHLADTTAILRVGRIGGLLILR